MQTSAHYGVHWGDIILIVAFVVVMALLFFGVRAAVRMVRRHG
jgi:hypothetical protein